LNSHNHPTQRPDSQFWMLSRQETESPTKNVGIIVSYQRNHQHNKQPQKGHPPCRRVKQTNSSTFDTLLSSQGSSAHRNPTFRPSAGQPGKTYRSGQGLSIRPSAPRLACRTGANCPVRQVKRYPVSAANTNRGRSLAAAEPEPRRAGRGRGRSAGRPGVPRARPPGGCR